MFWELAGRCIEIWRCNARTLAVISATWFALIVAWVLFLKSGAISGVSATSLKLAILVFHHCFNLLAGVAIAVTWHRFILLREVPECRTFKLSGNEVGYCSCLLTISFIWGVVVGLPALLLFAAFGKYGFYWVGLLILLLLPLSYRLSLVLPAAAIGESFSFFDAWKVSRGMGLPMLLANLVLLIPVFGIAFILSIFSVLVRRIADRGFYILTDAVVEQVIGLSMALAYVTILSVSYNYAKERWFSEFN